MSCFSFFKNPKTPLLRLQNGKNKINNSREQVKNSKPRDELISLGGEVSSSNRKQTN
jgi:hypothetical protein